MTGVRIKPLPPEQFTEEQAALVGAWKDMNFARVVINSPRMYRTFVAFLAECIAKSALPPRDRQVVCLRMLELCGDTYELTHHILISKQQAGLEDSEVSAMRKGAGEDLTEFDRILLNATEELFSEKEVSDATWRAMAARYSDEQLMEVVFLAGCYHTMAMVTKSFGMQLEDQETFESFKKIRNYK